MDWPLILTIACIFVAMGFAFILGACWLAGEADERAEAEADAKFQTLWAEHHRRPE